MSINGRSGHKKAALQGWVSSPVLKPLLRYLEFVLECLGFSSGSTPDSRFRLMHILRVRADGSVRWVPATQEKDPVWVSGSKTLGFCGNLGSESVVWNSLSLSLFSAFYINT